MKKMYFVITALLLLSAMSKSFATIDTCVFRDLGEVKNQNDLDYVNKKQHRSKSADVVRYMEINFEALKRDTLYLCLPTGYQIGFKVAHRDTTNGVVDIKLISVTNEGSVGQLTIERNGIQGLFRDRIQDDLWIIIKLNKFRTIITNTKGSIPFIDEETRQIIKRGCAN